MYTLYKETNLTAAAEVITVQQPAGGTGKRVELIDATLYSAVAADFTLERDGTAASSTTLTPTPWRSGMPVATAGGYSSSNVGTGTVLHKETLTAGGRVVLDLVGYSMFDEGAGRNYSIRTNAVTGIVRIALRFKETNIK